jgi:hypothetical protein
MNAIKVLMAVVVVAGVSGCQTRAQMEAKELQEKSAAAKVSLDACLAVIEGKPFYAMVDRKTRFKGGPTFEQKADTAMITPEEAAAVMDVRNYQEGCRQQFLEHLTGRMAAAKPVFLDSWARSDANLVGLINKKLSWGDYNLKRAESTSQFNKELAEVDRRTVEGLNQEHQAQVKAVKDTAAALQRWNDQQQLLNAINRPRVYDTSCNQAVPGGTVNCNTVRW